MPHIILLMNTKFDELIGDATSGPLVTARANVNAADLYVELHKVGGSPQDELHEILESIQTTLVDGGSLSEGIGDTVAGWNTEIENLLP